jgi:dihydropteroate synthase
MRGKETISFRILHPEPFDLTHSRNLPLDLTCAVEFSSPFEAVRFQKAILLIPYLRHVRLEGRKPVQVLWSVTWPQAFLLHKHLLAFPEVSRQITEGLKGFNREGDWTLRLKNNKKKSWDKKTQVMGILNVTPDSFSDGGRYLDPLQAAERALRLQDEGADWIDIGGESTRPGSKRVPAAEEKKRILPVIKACVKTLRAPLSVDTYKAEVARAAVGEGAQMVNDISAMTLDPQMGKTISVLKVPVILMHMRGNPKTMQKKPVYRDVVGDILSYFRERLDFARRCGIAEDRILLDPGLGFGKTDQHNLTLLRHLWQFKVLGKPIVSAPSRKGTLGRLLGGLPPEERVEATAAAVSVSVLKSADFVRVHDVQSMVRVVKIADAIRYRLP